MILFSISPRLQFWPSRGYVSSLPVSSSPSPGCIPIIMQYHPFPMAFPPTQYFPPLKSDTRRCHSHCPSLLSVRPIFNFLRPLNPTPSTCGWMWVPSSRHFIRLCDRIQHCHKHNIFGVSYGCAIGSSIVTSTTCLAFHTALRSDPALSQAQHVWRFIRLCDRIHHCHQHNVFSLLAAV